MPVDLVEVGVAVCSKCQKVRPLSEFSPCGRKANRRNSWCKECVAARKRDNRLEGKISPAVKRAHNLKSRYGLTPDQVDEMLADQDHRCAICRQPFERQFHIDHNHTTGAVRGILCHRCNVRLPFIEDEAFRLSALAYLETHRALPLPL